MNEINIKINFQKGTCIKSKGNLITGDYNSTKLLFDFDKQDGTKIFEMNDPQGKLLFVKEIINNEVILTREDENGNNCSLFHEIGQYRFEVSLYENDSKLTSASNCLDVSKEQVVINDEIVEVYLPIFDEMIKELNDALIQTNNLDISVSKKDKVSTITVTKKDGSTESVDIKDGDGGGTGGTSDYEELENKPSINGTELIGNKTLEDLGIDQNFVKDNGYVHTDNNYTTADKNKLFSLSNYDDTKIREELKNKANKSEIPDVSGFVRDNNYIHTDNNYTKEEKEKLKGLSNYNDTVIKEELRKKANITDIPTVPSRVSELENDSNFVDNTVSNLLNYYLKEEVYSKEEVQSLISTINTFSVEVVEQLPTLDIDTHTIYLVPKEAEENDNYNEYIYINNDWEHIGSTNVDLTGYIKNTDFASNSQAGVVTINNNYGVDITSTTKSLMINKATNGQIESRSTNYRPIVPGNLDFAMKIGITTNTEVLTEQEKKSAKNWLGISDGGGGSGGGDNWRIISDVIIEEPVTAVTVTTDMEGNPFTLKKVAFVVLGNLESSLFVKDGAAFASQMYVLPDGTYTENGLMINVGNATVKNYVIKATGEFINNVWFVEGNSSYGNAYNPITKVMSITKPNSTVAKSKKITVKPVNGGGVCFNTGVRVIFYGVDD